MTDLRQRFYIDDSPVRGEVVHLEETLQTILAQRKYAPAVQILLGEMLSATALLASTLKIKGRISLQIQAQGAFKWAMAECNHLGEVRALAEYEEDARFASAQTSSTVLSTLQQPVLFINIEPEVGERYQGIVPLDKPTLAACLMQYYDFYHALPAQVRSKAEEMPRQALYTLASRDGDLKQKIAFVTCYKGETKQALLIKIRDLFPLAEQDKRREKRGEALIRDVERIHLLISRKKVRLSKLEKDALKELLSDISSLL